MGYQIIEKGIVKYFDLIYDFANKFAVKIIKYPFLHETKPNPSTTQLYVYFSSIRIQTGVIVRVQSLGDAAIFQQWNFLCKSYERRAFTLDFFISRRSQVTINLMRKQFAVRRFFID